MTKFWQVVHHLVAHPKVWQVAHHLVAHPLIGVSGGRLWAWRFHDWTLPKAWPGETNEPHRSKAGLE